VHAQQIDVVCGARRDAHKVLVQFARLHEIPNATLRVGVLKRRPRLVVSAPRHGQAVRIVAQYVAGNVPKVALVNDNALLSSLTFVGMEMEPHLILKFIQHTNIEHKHTVNK
jgi:hypothetical protein